MDRWVLLLASEADAEAVRAYQGAPMAENDARCEPDTRNPLHYVNRHRALSRARLVKVEAVERGPEFTCSCPGDGSTCTGCLNRAHNKICDQLDAARSFEKWATNHALGLESLLDAANARIAELEALTNQQGDNLAALVDLHNRAVRIGGELTLETQTVEEMTADIVRQVRDARKQRGAALAEVEDARARAEDYRNKLNDANADAARSLSALRVQRDEALAEVERLRGGGDDV